MIIKYLYQIPNNQEEKITYEFTEETIRVMMPDKITDEFDFTGLPDGELDSQSIRSNITPSPLISAKKEDGLLIVELLQYVTIEEYKKIYHTDEKEEYDGGDEMEE